MENATGLSCTYPNAISMELDRERGRVEYLRLELQDLRRRVKLLEAENKKLRKRVARRRHRVDSPSEIYKWRIQFSRAIDQKDDSKALKYFNKLKDKTSVDLTCSLSSYVRLKLRSGESPQVMMPFVNSVPRARIKDAYMMYGFCLSLIRMADQAEWSKEDLECVYDKVGDLCIGLGLNSLRRSIYAALTFSRLRDPQRAIGPLLSELELMQLNTEIFDLFFEPCIQKYPDERIRILRVMNAHYEIKKRANEYAMREAMCQALCEEAPEVFGESPAQLCDALSNACGD